MKKRLGLLTFSNAVFAGSLYTCIETIFVLRLVLQNHHCSFFYLVPS